MKRSEWVKDNVGYGRELVSSGFQGARSAWKTSAEDVNVASAVARMARDSWKPGVAGAILGAVAGYLLSERERTKYTVIGSLLGGAIGLSGSMTWSGRRVIGGIASEAMHNINEVRDQRWLDKNPIDYA
jgi:hypothetical protein